MGRCGEVLQPLLFCILPKYCDFILYVCRHSCIYINLFRNVHLSFLHLSYISFPILLLPFLHLSWITFLLNPFFFLIGPSRPSHCFVWPPKAHQLFIQNNGLGRSGHLGSRTRIIQVFTILLHINFITVIIKHGEAWKRRGEEWKQQGPLGEVELYHV